METQVVGDGKKTPKLKRFRAGDALPRMCYVGMCRRIVLS